MLIIYVSKYLKNKYLINRRLSFFFISIGILFHTPLKFDYLFYDYDVLCLYVTCPQMRNTKKVSMWPVGLCTRTGLSTPIVKNGKLIGFYDGWIAGRKFPVDMAGFAVSVKFLLEVSYNVKFRL